MRSVAVPFLVCFLLVFGAESLLQSKESSELKSSSWSLYLDWVVVAMLADKSAAYRNNVAIKLKQVDDEKKRKNKYKKNRFTPFI